MGSGISACTGPGSVGINEGGGENLVRFHKSGGGTSGVHSDSCDSGISVSDGPGGGGLLVLSSSLSSSSSHSIRHKSKASRYGNRGGAHVESDEEEDIGEGGRREEGAEGAEGKDMACGPDLPMTSTPRHTDGVQSARSVYDSINYL